MSKKYKRIDLLFNNAGIGSKASSIDKISKDWKGYGHKHKWYVFMC